MTLQHSVGGLAAILTLTVSAMAGVPEIRIEPNSIFIQDEPNPTIFVELDWMEGTNHNHRPSQAVLDTIFQTFLREGYVIQFELGNAVPHQEVIEVGPGAPSAAPQVQAILAAHFQNAGDPRYHYSLWGHEYSVEGQRSGSSGVADLPGRVSLVTLGTFANQVGTERNQVGTFIHEFGHNLGQRHGGEDNSNHEPNYVGVMNYTYQLDGIVPALAGLEFHPTGGGFNEFSYSHGIFGPLNESNLSEPAGIGLGPVDWNRDGDTLDNGVVRDISIPDWRSTPQNPVIGTLTDFDNWASVPSFIRTGAGAGVRNAVSSPPERCITSDEYAAMLAANPELQALTAQPLPPVTKMPTTQSLSGPTNNQATFTIFNDGDADLQITALTPPQGVTHVQFMPSAPFNISPNQSQVVTVTVDRTQLPSQVTRYFLAVTSNDPDDGLNGVYPGAVHLTAIREEPAAATLSLFVTPRFSGNVFGGGGYQTGQQVNIGAAPFLPYQFQAWLENGQVFSTSANAQVPMTGDRTLIAVSQAPSGQPNDKFADRSSITGASGTLSASNSGTVLEPFEPVHAGSPSPTSSWWTWTAPGSGTATFDTFGSNFDTVLAVYRGDELAALTESGSNDDAFMGTGQSQVTIDILQGHTYQIAVGAYDFPNIYGNITLNWNASGTIYATQDIVDALLGVGPPPTLSQVDFNEDGALDAADLVWMNLHPTPAP